MNKIFSSILDRNKLEYFFLLFIIVLSIVYFFASVETGFPTRDSGSYLFGGKMLLEGKIPYRDFWDNKGPVIFIIDSLALLFNPSLNLINLLVLEIIFFIISLILLYLTIKLISGKLIAFISLLFYLFTVFPYLFESGNLTETYALLFQLIIAYFTVRIIITNNFNILYPFTIGVSGALLFLLRPNLISVLVSSVAVFSLFTFFNHIQFRKNIQNIKSLLIGFVIILALFLAYFILTNSLVSFIDAVFIFNFYYSKKALIEKVGTMITGLQVFNWLGILSYTFLGGVLTVLYIIKWDRRQIRSLLIKGFFLLWLFLEIGLSSLSGNRYYHYYLSWVPSIILLSSVFWDLFYRNIERIFEFNLRIKSNIVKIGFFILFLGVVNTQYLYVQTDKTIRAFSNLASLKITEWRYQKEAVKYIVTHTNNNDYIFIWGAEQVVYLASGRMPASRFTYQMPLIFNGYAKPEIFYEINTSINENKPVVIIDAANTLRNFPEINCSADVNDNFKIIYDNICSNYHYVLSFENGWKAYSRNLD